MTTPDCPLGGPCKHQCEVTCEQWADRAHLIANGQEQPVEPSEIV